MPITLPALVARIYVVLAVLLTPVLAGQDPPEAEVGGVPVIADEPKAIDPATLLPETLARKMTADFSQAALSEVGNWIRVNAGIPVLFDESALDDIGISLSEPVSDRLTDDSLYLLLDRLRSLELSWYLQDDVVRITTADEAADHAVTTPYHLGNLLDSDFDAASLADVITTSLGGDWLEADGEGGSVELLGDVLFVRQTDDLHLRLRGLLTALENHGKQTYISDPPQHELLRTTLYENVTLNFDDVPLIEAVQRLSQQCGIDIRLDSPSLRDDRIRDRQPVSLVLANRQLRTALEVLLSELELTWMLRDGVLWITSQGRASAEFITAVYDVRDLCRDEDESVALTGAIQSQTGTLWDEIDGEGGTIIFARPGTMVIRHTDREHDNVLRLLNAYRSALMNSKRRERKDDPEDEILTRYYSMQQAVAARLREFLQRNVDPTSWKTEESPDAIGVIDALLPAGKSIVTRQAHPKSKESSSEFVTHNSVLVITQSRANHREITNIIRRIEHGDDRPIDPPGVGGGGGGGGGFGGVFFSLDTLNQSQVR